MGDLVVAKGLEDLVDLADLGRVSRQVSRHQVSLTHRMHKCYACTVIVLNIIHYYY